MDDPWTFFQVKILVFLGLRIFEIWEYFLSCKNGWNTSENLIAKSTQGKNFHQAHHHPSVLLFIRFFVSSSHPFVFLHSLQLRSASFTIQIHHPFHVWFLSSLFLSLLFLSSCFFSSIRYSISLAFCCYFIASLGWRWIVSLSSFHSAHFSLVVMMVSWNEKEKNGLTRAWYSWRENDSVRERERERHEECMKQTEKSDKRRKEWKWGWVGFGWESGWKRFQSLLTTAF